MPYTKRKREELMSWTLTVTVPADVPPRRAGRFMARLLKHLLRVWGVKCVGYEESAEVKRLRGIIDGLAARVAAQCELLARRAERK